MSGHSKWSQIKGKKELTDKKKAQLFSRISKLITIAARKGTDPKANPALAQMIEKAKSMNMPNDNIERAIKKVSDKSQNQPEEIVIEAIGPGGVPLRIKVITDNKNRTIPEIRKILGDHASKLVPPGSISWMFNSPTGEAGMPTSEIDEDSQKKLDALFEALDEHDDVEDVESNLQ